MRLIIVILSILLSLSNSNILSAQRVTSDEYWDAYGIAMKHYDNEDYIQASKAFEQVWSKPNDEEMAWHRLRAAAANCMIDNEDGVRKNLYKIISVANKDDIKRVLVNYQIFNKYKKLDWWEELEAKLNDRLMDLIAHHQNLKIFQKGRNITYSALRINVNGDTLANTTIEMIPDGTGWGDEAADLQSQVIFKYSSMVKDSIDHIQEIDSIVGERFWVSTDTTGVIENTKRVWMHPFRNNEFFKTELAPFPVIKFPVSDSIMQSYKMTTHILGNWGLYTGTKTKERYNYIGKVIKSYPTTGEIECYKLIGTGENTKYGISKIEYFYSEIYGFTEMNYLTYDNDIIEFKIVEIRNTN